MKKILAVFLAVALALSGTAALADSEEPKMGGDLVIGLGYEPDTLNVYSTHLLGDVQAMIVEGLLVPNADMEYVPQLATEVPTVENGGIELHDDGTMDITYHLRDNVYWHCGEKLTSADVAYTWECLKNPEFEAESKDGVDDIESIDCPDDLTVVCHYLRQTPDYAQTLFTFGIMPKHDIEGVDMNDPNNGYNDQPCGTGPYKFVEWVRGEYIKLERNDNYWGDNGPYLDTVTFRFVTDENTRINMLKTGEIDFTYGIGFPNYDQVSEIEGTTTIVHPLNSWCYLDFNQKVPGLDDVNVRRAIACAIDKQSLVDQLFGGIPIAWDQPWMSSDPFHVDGFQSEWSYDPEKAAQILDDAGWVMGSDGVREKDGTKLEFVISCNSSSANYVDVEQVIIGFLSQVGIKATAENAAASTWTANMYAGEYEMGVGGYITSPGATRTTMYANPDEGGLLNRGSWINDEFTALANQMDLEMDEQARKELVEQALAIFDSELPQLVVYNNTEIDVVNENLKGFEPNPTNMTNFCQSAGWWLDE